jgi:hypothetical protein
MKLPALLTAWVVENVALVLLQPETQAVKCLGEGVKSRGTLDTH